ncbi:MAG: hypothetical protein ACOY0T_39215 [Myxococcota bacterium]
MKCARAYVSQRDELCKRRLKARSLARRVRDGLVYTLLAGVLACSDGASFNTQPRAKSVKAALRELRSREKQLRRVALVTPPLRAEPLGPDPARLCALGANVLGLLRGSSELVLLDQNLIQRARTPGPVQPSACASLDDTQVAVVGAEPAVFMYHVADSIELAARIAIPNVVAPRALVANHSMIYVADEVTGSLHIWERARQRWLAPLELCRRPVALALTDSHLVANCLYDHALSIRTLTPEGLPTLESARIGNAGPFWDISVLQQQGRLLIAASGVEDHRLERFDGAFGYVDSFVQLFGVRGHTVERLWSANVSDHSVLVPKAIALGRSATALTLWVSSSGTDRLLRFAFDASHTRAEVSSSAFVPGVSDLLELPAGLFAASTLLDAWASWNGSMANIAPVSSALPKPKPSLRLGEALAFTSLIAPRATSAGRASRFTCETCHFEGGIDARVHHTGRGDVHVVTRPLFGLLRNAPHFSRALDADLTSVSHNEFRVAGLGNPHDPWFTLRVGDYPWLSALGIHEDVEPEALRGALMEFLAQFEFEQNPRTRGRYSFTPLEQRGARIFEQRCERCHAARRMTDEPESRVDSERWQSFLFDGVGALVWARGEYAFTSVLPYVNERGTRIPSLRRVADKFPYFTNGSARSLAEVLQRASEVAGEFSHAAPDSNWLPSDEQRALLAFLELL